MAVAIIFILAFSVRAYNLGIMPLNHDESYWSLRSLEHFDKFIGIPVTCFKGYIQPFFSYLVFVAKNFSFSPELIVRIPAVIIGSLTVIVVYILAKEMFGKIAGWVSALLLCFLPWHVIQSKIGVSAILVPFFGGLIFYTLFISLRKRSKAMFMLSWLLLGIGSFYTYQAAVVFVVIFISVLLFLKEEFAWVKKKTILISALFFFIVLFPLIYLQITDKIDFSSVFYRTYQHNPFRGQIVINLLENFKNNASTALKCLFINSKGMIIYCEAHEQPLLISRFSLAIIIFSLLTLFLRRNVADKIILSWFFLGFLGSLAGVDDFQPRYIIIILVPLIMLIGNGVAKMFEHGQKNSLLKSRSLFFTGIFVCVLLSSEELQQLWNYYYIAPTDLEECHRNSNRCEEAAKYLSNDQDIENCKIITDIRMTTLSYLKYAYHINPLNLYSTKNIRKDDSIKIVTYYILWAPQSHPKEYWQGLFLHKYASFMIKYPQENPVKTIYYPNGLAAIYIFKVLE